MQYVSRFDKSPEILFFDSKKYDPALGFYPNAESINNVLSRARSCLGVKNKLNPIAGYSNTRYYCTQLRFGVTESSNATETEALPLYKLVSRTSNPTRYIPGGTSRPELEDNEYSPYGGTSEYAQNVVLTGRVSGQTYFLPEIGHNNTGANPSYSNYSLYNVVTYGMVDGGRNMSNSRTPNQYMTTGVLYTVQFSATMSYVLNAAYMLYGGRNQFIQGGQNYPVYIQTNTVPFIIASGPDEKINLDCFLVSWDSNTFYKFDSSNFEVDADLLPRARPTVAFTNNYNWKQCPL